MDPGWREYHLVRCPPPAPKRVRGQRKGKDAGGERTETTPAQVGDGVNLALTPSEVPRLRPIDSTRIPSAVKSRKCDAFRDTYTNVKECTSLDTRYHGGGLMELRFIVPTIIDEPYFSFLLSLNERRCMAF
ncbi:hypothetical protein NDU88_006108 [Pleurodeles waltl]|uniref:Uncharacterized protein n=1 Tax=Pleurodeles waltl TaxID=8319 RepID=A0AAV7WDF6_PLEWA|nr:hypothetical protein NDU88_006108 [Pleurodeles waltl]